MDSRTLLPFLKPIERKICQRLNISITNKFQGPLIAIGGLAGVGKDTLALGLKERFSKKNIDLSIFGAGDFMREYSRQRGYPDKRLDEFLKTIKDDEDFAKEVDFYIDKQTMNQALLLGTGIFIGRMAPFALGSWATSIWLYVKPERRARRLVLDSNRPEYGMDENEVLLRMKKRDDSDITRLERIYGIKIQELSQSLDIHIDNSLNTINQTIDIAYDRIIHSSHT